MPYIIINSIDLTNLNVNLKIINYLKEKEESYLCDYGQKFLNRT